MMAAPTVWQGIRMPTLEHAYQAAKYTDPQHWAEIAKLPTASKSKYYARSHGIETPDWHTVKYGIMYQLCCQKWSQEPFRTLLLSHSDTIVEWNNWSDIDWGVAVSPQGIVKGGKNNLGAILMQIRDALRRDKDPSVLPYVPNQMDFPPEPPASEQLSFL